VRSFATTDTNIHSTQTPIPFVELPVAAVMEQGDSTGVVNPLTGLFVGG